jgi:quercetin dioxygenase-like cupin family protein
MILIFQDLVKHAIDLSYNPLNHNIMKTVSFQQDLEFDENRIKTQVIIETIFSKEIRILLKAGQVMKEHKTPYPILIHVLSGQIKLGLGENHELMGTGDIMALDGDVKHDLLATENTVVRLTLSKHDKIERLKDVINA